MIVYSNRTRSEDPRGLLASLRQGLEDPAADPVSLLIAAGVLEAGLVDALSREEDDEPPLAQALRGAMLDLAHAGRGDVARRASALERLGEIERSPLPESVAVSEPEGFAFYALYPETYAEAARRFLRATRPTEATVIGLRSIGTTLSAVVAAEIEAAGRPVRRFTVRPRGHPFERDLHLGPRLQAALEEAGHVLVVDEGPGLSGSSFACVAEAAIRAGVPEHRIALFPSWDSDGAGLRSERARALWPRLRRWVVSFEETFLATGRLAAAWGGGTLRDLSGGLWREAVYPGHHGPGGWPAVQPQHERRKYLLKREDGSRVLLKYAGLGVRGERALARAARQAEARLAPPVLGHRDGFLAMEWMEGSRADPEGLALMVRDADSDRRRFPWTQRIGFYLAHTAADPVGAVRFDDLLAMTRLNVAEGLGEDWVGRLGWMEGMRETAEARPAVAVDGRMMPWEWLRSAGRVLKFDGVDHHDDHFWPGTQDVAWDVAGAMVEWRMDTEAREQLLGRYEFWTRALGPEKDTAVREVLPFYETAYLAWRLGYTTLAAETLGGSEDGLRMARDRDRYAALLREALERGAT